MSQLPNLRGHYRVVFPLGARPWFRLRSTLLPVLDCSETGLRLHVGTRSPFEIGGEVSGVVRFADGEQCPASGVVIRQEDGHAVVHLLHAPLPFGIILRQQFQLRRLARLEGEPDAGPGGD